MFRSALLLPLVLLVAATARGDEAPAPVSFREHVAPILVRKCLGCHNARKAEGGLSMATFAALRKGGEKGGDLILEPGDPDSSQLIELVRPGGAPRMPYKQPPIGEGEVRTLERWVKEGARFDGASEAETAIASLVDPLRDLPRVVVKSPAPDPVTSLVYTPDGKALAAASGQDVILFDAATGKPGITLEGSSGRLTTVRLTPDGKTLIAVGGRPGIFGSITAWDLATKARRFDVRGHADSVLGAAVSPDGKTLATAGYDRLVKLWDLATGKELRALTEHTDAVYAVAFSPDGKTLASAGADRTVKVWHVASGRRLKTLSDATAELYSVAFGPAGDTVLAAGVDRSIRAWRVSEKDAPLVSSVFAHDAAVVRLAVSADGKTLASSGEDRHVKLWDLPELKPRAGLGEQADWPQALAISPDGSRVAVGRHDGSLSVYESATGKLSLALKSSPGAAAAAPKPVLLRNASLNPPSPRGAARGAKVRMTLTGNGVGLAVSVLFDDPGLKGTLLPVKKVDPNRLELDLVVAPEARVGIHRVGVVTPLGVPAPQPFAVSAFAESPESEPNDVPSAPKPTPFPATFVGTIDRPGDVDHFRFEAKAGDQLVFEARAKSLGSKLRGILTVEEAGAAVGEASTLDGSGDPVLALAVPRDGVYTLKVADADYAGSGGHFYRIEAGASPYLTGVFPLGVERGKTATLEVSGRNLRGVERVDMPVAPEAMPGSLPAVPVVVPGGAAPVNRRTVVVADGPQAIEAEGNDTAQRATPVAVPGGASGRVAKGGDVDHFRFEARKGRRLIVEVFGRRLGTPIDPVIEILDAKGVPVPRAVLRPVDQTEVAFRDHDSSKPGIRLTRWNNLAIDDYVLIGRELARIKALPRNPDDDCAFWSERNVRLGFLETTPEHHPEAQPIYKVTIHPPGTTFPAGGVPPVTLTYRNDDGGPDFSADSRLTFDPPADGAYVVRVEDVRGLGGEDFGYHLVVRPPRPGFRLAVDADDPDVPRGGTTLVTARISRVDGFDGPVDVTADGLPPGVVATPARIEAGDFTASLALTAEASAPAFSPPSWRLTGRAVAGPGPATAAVDLVHEYDPGGPAGGRITVTPGANVEVEASPTRLAIRPGRQVSLRLAVRRGAAFAGRVPIEIRNLPQGVRVLNIGLNGVLITEKETERTIFLYAEPWVGGLERPFYAVGKAEAAATEHSSPPIVLVVVEPGGGELRAEAGRR